MQNHPFLQPGALRLPVEIDIGGDKGSLRGYHAGNLGRFTHQVELGGAGIQHPRIGSPLNKLGVVGKGAQRLDDRLECMHVGTVFKRYRHTARLGSGQKQHGQDNGQRIVEHMQQAREPKTEVDGQPAAYKGHTEDVDKSEVHSQRVVAETGDMAHREGQRADDGVEPHLHELVFHQQRHHDDGSDKYHAPQSDGSDRKEGHEYEAENRGPLLAHTPQPETHLLQYGLEKTQHQQGEDGCAAEHELAQIHKGLLTGDHHACLF